MTGQAEPFRILTVCTGNICRSPFAERLLRSAFDRIAVESGDHGFVERIEVGSAGTRGMVGSPMTPEMIEVAELHGAVADGHVARQLDADLVRSADLVLALTRSHRREVVELLPRASRTTFALTEFARLLDDAAAAGLVRWDSSLPFEQAFVDLVDAAASRRGFVPLLDDPALDDVVDPYGLDRVVYDESAAQIAAAVSRIEAVVSAAVGIPA